MDTDYSEIEGEDLGGGGGWSTWPEGEYRVRMVYSDKGLSGAGDEMWSFEYECADGPRAGETIRDYLVTGHTKEQVRKIALKSLRKLEIATGFPEIGSCADSSQMHVLEFDIYVTRKKDSGKYADADGYVNNVADYKPLEGNQTNPTPPAPPPQQPNDNPGAPPAGDIPF
jgi:hypothetical protein